MQIKVPNSLVTFPKNQQVIVYNYLTKDVISCAPSDIYWLTVAADWTEIDNIVADHPEIEPLSLKRELGKLVEAGILMEEGSPQAKAEAHYVKTWELGLAVGLFHFAALDNEFGTMADSIAKQKEKNITNPSPPLYWRNSGNAIKLPECAPAQSGQLFEVMKRRRTSRNVENTSISLQHLTESLFAGLGITGFVQTETALLPLKMTPSGGARNPFEAFVWARNIEGLDPGIYHYSALEHSLQFVTHGPNIAPQEFVQRQDWADNMPAIVFLVAVLERVTWKYNDPNAYRVVMIEAGHIAQNMMLACAKNDLTACPTAALNHTQISNLLGLSSITQTPIYALLIGKPDGKLDEVLPLDSLRN